MSGFGRGRMMYVLCNEMLHIRQSQETRDSSVMKNMKDVSVSFVLLKLCRSFLFIAVLC